MIPADIVALADYERHALAIMSPSTAAYIQGGGADGITRDANRAAWDTIRLNSRNLRDMRGAHTRLSLLRTELEHPILLAPVAWHGLAHPEAETATAIGAGALKACMTVSTQSGTLLEDVSASALGPLWFQLYFQMSRDDMLALAIRATHAGYRALVVTIDAPVNGIRNMEQRAGFQLPAHIRAVNLKGMAVPPHIPTHGESPVFKGLLDTAPTWDDIAWLVQQTKLPIILKGVMSVDDAALALEAGVSGIIVSNHGGRALDTLPPTAEALPLIAAEVAGRVPVLCDGGIRRGTDILKALALGASAVLIGRPHLHALTVGDAAGVAHMLLLLRVELEVAMALTGCRTLEEIGEEVIWKASELRMDRREAL